MKIITLTIICMFFLNASSFYSQEYEWVFNGEYDYEEITSMTTDNSGNILKSSGHNSVQLIATAGSSGVTIGNGFAVIFITKYNNSGDTLWSKKIGDINDVRGKRITSISTDSQDNIYITGCFNGYISFNNIDSIQAVNFDSFIIKLDSDGNLIWDKHITGDLGNYITSIVIDNDDNLIISGTNTGTNILIGAFQLNTDPDGYATLFFSKLDNNGNVLWAKTPATNGYSKSKSTALTVDDFGNIYIIGTFLDNTPLSQFFDNIQTIGSGSERSFLVKFDSFGIAQWLRNPSDNHDMSYLSIKIDSENNVVLAGNYKGSVNFGGVQLISPYSNSIYYSDVFFTKLNTLGGLLYVKQATSNGYQTEFTTGVNLMSIDKNDNIFIGGHKPGIAGDPNNRNHSIIRKYDVSGFDVWFNKIGSQSNSMESSLYILTLDKCDNVYLAGIFGYTYTLNFDDIILNKNTLNSKSFLAKIKHTNIISPVISSSSNNICAGDSITISSTVGNSYQWSNGEVSNQIIVKDPGTFSLIFIDQNGCSSYNSNEISISVFPKPNKPNITVNGNTEFCQGENVELISSTATSYNWYPSNEISRNILASITGDYYVKITNSFGCSNYSDTITITVNNTSNSIETISACENYSWNGFTYTTSGNYSNNFTNIYGCDSIAYLNLTILQPSTSSETVVACDSYSWNGNNYTLSGTYSANFTNEAGCDSLATLYLTINNSTFSSETIEACESYSWNGNTYNASGTYTANLTTTNGCDSLVTLHLTIKQPTSSSETISTCYSYSWNNQTYTQSGTYTANFTNVNGCDSLATLNLTILQPSSSTETIVACDSFTWNGNNYTLSGTYSANFTNEAGCDSLATLNLSINNSIISSETIEACDSYSWNGNNYNASGTYTANLTTTSGCDSLITLHLTIINSTSSSETIQSCDSYTWNNQTYTQSGIYTSNFINAAGCDSIATLILTINNSSSSSASITVCDSYSWNGDTYTTSGVYSKTLINSKGCDSITTLNLTINNSSTSSESITTCNSYNWNGTNYNSSGIYTANLTTISGCDSIATLILTVNSSSSSNETISACESYTWNGNTYNSSGNYLATLVNAKGCDSICSLNLTILQPTNSTETVSICENYTWNGFTYNSSGTYTATLTNSNGCDSIATLNLTINESTSGLESISACTSFSWNGNTYSSSGTYTANLINSTGCDSLATLNLTILESTTGSEIVANCENYTWHGTTYTNSGSYTTTLTNSNGCDSIVTLNLTINPLPTVNLPNLGSYCDTLDSFALTDGTPAGGQYSGTSVNNNNFDPSIGEGTYTITYTYSDANGCSNSDNGNLNVIECINSVSMNESTISTFNIYPNPTNSKLNIIVKETNSLHKVKVMNFSGQILNLFEFESSTFTLDFSTFAKGIYFVEVDGYKEKVVFD